jgi:hypothetical protein
MIKKFLQPFYRAILETQRDHAIIDNIFLTINIIIQYFEIALINRFTFKSNNINIVQ